MWPNARFIYILGYSITEGMNISETIYIHALLRISTTLHSSFSLREVETVNPIIPQVRWSPHFSSWPGIHFIIVRP